MNEEHARRELWTPAQEESFAVLTRDAGADDAKVVYDHMFKTVMLLNFHGMLVGIEKDGYAHS